VAQSSWTTPSHASMMTGLTPAEHGLIYYENPGKLGDDIPTLAGIMRDAGYATAGFYGGAFLNPKFGLDRGFDVYQRGGKSFKENINLSITWIKENSGRKFFLFLHGFDVHRPYNLSSEENIFYDYNGTYDVSSFCLDEGNWPETDDEEEYVISQYDTGVRHADDLLGGFIRFLEDEGLMEDTVVIITADHGKLFFEHEWCGHVSQVYEEALHVPLIVRTPGSASKRIAGQVPASISILPTVMGLAGIDAEVNKANSLQSFLESGHPAFEYIVSETGRGSPGNETRFKRSIRTEKWKLVYFRKENITSYFLFDLENDPREKEDKSGEYPQVFNEMKKLNERIKLGHAPSKAELDEETIEQLKALGYLR
ncbi:MAG: sulfatase-like hydrolase/transferase, partial [Candidatus Altiarchaeota archaeon]